MGIFSRFSDIINSNINVMLEKAEDPEKIIRLVIQEMEDTLVEVRTNAARTLADKKSLARKYAQLQEEAEEWSRKAELAIRKQRDDLARAALAEKSKLESTLQHIDTDLAEIDRQVEKLNTDMGNLQIKLQEAKDRRKTLMMRQQTSVDRVRTQRQLNSRRVDNALAKFEHLERKIDELEGDADSYALAEESSLQAQFSKLEAEDKIDAELQAIKQKIEQTDKQ